LEFDRVYPEGRKLLKENRENIQKSSKEDEKKIGNALISLGKRLCEVLNVFSALE
jgi:hypothetical protein